MDKPHEYKLTVRVPEDLHAGLDAMRKRERRTLHAQMLWCMEQCLERFKREEAKQEQP